jgi:hypothetical protein
MLVNEINSMPYIKSLPNCPHHIIAQGFDKDFKVSRNGWQALETGIVYMPLQVRIAANKLLIKQFFLTSLLYGLYMMQGKLW